MGKQPTNPSTPSISRRAGIDRRWITTVDYHPERRSGKDRRASQQRAFLTPIDSDDHDQMKKPLPVNPSEDGMSPPTFFQTPEAALTDETSGD